MRCYRCKKPFTPKANYQKRYSHTFCSRACSDLYKKEAAASLAEKIYQLGKKQCKLCSRTRLLKYFPKSKQSSSGYFSYCHDCRREINRAQDRKRYDKRREYSRNRHLVRTFGITSEDYDTLLGEQSGGCAICGIKKDSHKRLAVDHDAFTGRIRGILCENCNRAIGQFAHDAVRLNKAIEYLEGSNGRPRLVVDH